MLNTLTTTSFHLANKKEVDDLISTLEAIFLEQAQGKAATLIIKKVTGCSTPFTTIIADAPHGMSWCTAPAKAPALTFFFEQAKNDAGFTVSGNKGNILTHLKKDGSPALTDGMARPDDTPNIPFDDSDKTQQVLHHVKEWIKELPDAAPQ